VEAEAPPEPATTAAPEGPSLALEFALDPAAAARLARHPGFAGARAGRSRSHAEELIWLDTADGALAATGLVLERPRRGPARLLRAMPPAGAGWSPGTPPLPATEALPEGPTLVPIAAFSGRRSATPLATPDGAVQAVLLAGKLRAVADERPVARLLLEGPQEAVLGLAGRFAGDLALLPPGAALAEEGRALARGEPPRARRRGPPNLADASTVEAALAGAIGHLVEVMLVYAPGCRLGLGPEGVHQTRVALRRLRSILRTFRPASRCAALDGFDRGLKTLADRLGPARDWDVFLGGLGAAAAEAMAGPNGPDKRMAQLLKSAEAKRQGAYHALRAELDGAGFRRLVLDGIALLHRRPWHVPPEGITAEERAARLAEPLADFASALLDKRWHKLHEEGEEIETHSAEQLHEVRLEAKRLRYAAELFAPLWPGKPTRRFLRRLAALQEDLGVANDTEVARGLVASLGPAVPAWAVGAVEGFAAARVAPARRHALDTWEGLMACAPFWAET